MRRVFPLVLGMILAACQSSIPAPPPVQGPRLLPVDEAASDPSLLRFRSDLLDAVRRRDAKTLLTAVDPKIRTTFGAAGGVADFRKQWKVDDPQSPLWEELSRILSLGGSFLRGGPEPQFWAPYVYSAWPDSQDAFTSLAVTSADVPLHQTAGDSSPVLATLSYDIVRGSLVPGQSWTAVTAADGRKGWVRSAQLRSPIGYRAGFVREGGRWRMNALVAGD